ncbi:hypothetical protein ACMFMF_011362 [Clarireedia jacksonii]
MLIALRKALKGLRKASSVSTDGTNALDEAYDKAIERIQRQNGDLPQDALLVLSWIVNAKRQITIPELRDALTVEIGKSELNKDNTPTIEHITSACAPLVVVDEESNIIRLVHYTTQEYFERTQKQWFPRAEATITTICTTYLSFSIFESGFCRTDDEFEQRIKSNPLYKYAAHNWGRHARQALTLCQDLTLCEEIVYFLNCEVKVEAASQVLIAVQKWLLDPNYSQRVPRQMTGIHLAAYFGIQEAINIMLGSQFQDSKDSYGRTPLSWAAERGHEAVVKLLESLGYS